MTNEERWEYIRKCLNEPDGAPDYYPVSIYSLQPGDTAWLAKRMLARDDVLWMLARHDVDIARVKELEAQAAANAKVQVAAEAVRAVVSYRDRQWGVVEWDALDAALAARKGE